VIKEDTGVNVIYPPMEKYNSEPPSYFFKGPSVAGILRAARYLIGLTMLQVSFNVPIYKQEKVLSLITAEKISEWQRENLVHTTLEPITKGGEYIGHRVVLRSFEFCLDSVYDVRSELLSFKRSFQSKKSRFYEFMSNMKYTIPTTIFTDARLCYPLFSVEDERNFDWSTIPKDKFFDYFYGGPYDVFQRQMGNGFPHDPQLSKNLNSMMNLSLSNSSSCIIDTNGNILQGSFVPPPFMAAPTNIAAPHQFGPLHPSLSVSSLASIPMSTMYVQPAPPPVPSVPAYIGDYDRGAVERAFHAVNQVTMMNGMPPANSSNFLIAIHQPNITADEYNTKFADFVNHQQAMYTTEMHPDGLIHDDTVDSLPYSSMILSE